MAPSINGKLDATDSTHKIRREDATGYIAPAFEGKEEQMTLGSWIFLCLGVVLS